MLRSLLKKRPLSVLLGLSAAMFTATLIFYACFIWDPISQQRGAPLSYVVIADEDDMITRKHVF